MNELASIKAMVVDDDANFLKVLSYTLSRMGPSVETATNGREALERILPDSFDVVLTDVKMPEMDGLSLLRELHTARPELPVILITAHGDIEMAVQAMKAGAVDFLTKPFEREELREKLDRAVRVRRLERENRALREELVNRYT